MLIHYNHLLGQDTFDFSVRQIRECCKLVELLGNLFYD